MGWKKFNNIVLFSHDPSAKNKDLPTLGLPRFNDFNIRLRRCSDLQFILYTYMYIVLYYYYFMLSHCYAVEWSWEIRRLRTMEGSRLNSGHSVTLYTAKCELFFLNFFIQLLFSFGDLLIRLTITSSQRTRTVLYRRRRLLYNIIIIICNNYISYKIYLRVTTTHYEDDHKDWTPIWRAFLFIVYWNTFFVFRHLNTSGLYHS